MNENTDPKAVVASGYDRMAERFARWFGRVGHDIRDRYTNALVEGLPPGARVLEIGCGSGATQTTRALARAFDYLGVDISRRQIEFARRVVPGARFLHADITQVSFPPESLDGVAAFYSLVHIPRDELGLLVERIATWLRPGGLVVASLTTRPDPGTIVPDWLGVPMYFSGFAAADGRSLVERVGLEIVSAQEETIDEKGIVSTFLWIVARKAAAGGSRFSPVPLARVTESESGEPA